MKKPLKIYRKNELFKGPYFHFTRFNVRMFVSKRNVKMWEGKTTKNEEVYFFFGWPFLGWIIISFILFRFFDIVKPFPINIVDKKMKNGLGVMLDDIIAGAYSAITIYIFYTLWF